MLKKNHHNLTDICLKMKFPEESIQILELRKEY